MCKSQKPSIEFDVESRKLCKTAGYSSYMVTGEDEILFFYPFMCLPLPSSMQLLIQMIPTRSSHMVHFPSQWHNLVQLSKYLCYFTSPLFSFTSPNECYQICRSVWYSERVWELKTLLGMLQVQGVGFFGTLSWKEMNWSAEWFSRIRMRMYMCVCVCVYKFVNIQT